MVVKDGDLPVLAALAPILSLRYRAYSIHLT